MAVNVGQPGRAPRITVGERFVIEAHQVENGRLKVVDMNFALRDVEEKIVSRTIDAGSDTATGHRHAEAARMVVAAGRGLPILPWMTELRPNSPPQITSSPDAASAWSRGIQGWRKREARASREFS